MELIYRSVIIALVFTSPSITIGSAAPQSDLERQALKLYDDGRYLQAEGIQRKALQEIQQRHGLQHPRTAEVLYQLARIASAQRRDQDASKLHLQALEIRQKTLGTSHPDVAISLTRISALLIQGGQFDRAEQLLKGALAILEAKLGSSHIEVANTLDILSYLYQTKACFDLAETANARAVAIAEKALPANHPDLATKLSNYGALKQTRGQLAEARELTAKSLKIREVALRPDHPDLAESLHNLALIEQSMGIRNEIEARFKQAISIWRTEYGPDHPLVATGLSNLGVAYMEAGRYAEAESVYLEGLAAAQARFGVAAKEVADANNNLGLLYVNMGRYAKAEPLLNIALRIVTKAYGPEHPQTGQVLNNLGNLYQVQARYAVAQPFYEKSLAIKEKAFGAQSAKVATSLQNLAITYHRLARPDLAEPHYRRALELVQKTSGADHPSVATVMQNLGALLEEQGRYSEAGTLLLRSITIREKSLGENHPNLGESLNNLAKTYLSVGKTKEMLALTKRAVEIWTKSLGADHPLVGRGMQSLGAVLVSEKRYQDALPFFRKALEIREQSLGPRHPEVAETLNTIGSLLGALGQSGEGERFLRRALSIREEKLPQDHPDIATTISALADLLLNRNPFPEARLLHTRALNMRRQMLGEEHPMVALSRNSLALIALRTDRIGDGLSDARKATNGLVIHSRLEAARGSAVNQADAGVLEGRTLDFRVHLLALQQAREQRLIGDKDAAGEAFTTGQWAIRTAAGKALSQLALRAAAALPELQQLVRNRQDVAAEWKRLSQESVTSASASDPDVRVIPDDAKKTRRESLERETERLDQEINQRFPNFTALADTSPLTVGQVQQHLRDNEALVQILVGAEQTHLWIVNKRDVVWRTLPVRQDALAKSVQTLRCGLDSSEWAREGGPCEGLIRGFTADGATAGKPLPFDANEAHTLYRTLFGTVSQEIAGKHLIMVLTGPLLRLPPQVMLKQAPPAGSAFNQWQWLGASHPVVLLPSVASLAPLRSIANRPGGAAFLGFGNPLLLGVGGRDKRAFAIRGCRGNKPIIVAEAETSVAEIATRGLSAKDRNDFSAIIQRQAPLPETADELCNVASFLGAGNDAVKLGKDATETEVKRLDAQGQFQNLAVLHFATHGVKAGELPSLQEPSLVMTPPTQSSAEDDGLLTASEVSRLKLNVDFTVLSACNTAAGQNNEDEAFAGLARAFLYAGSRGMLVSHWAVNTNAAVEIVTGLFRAKTVMGAASNTEAMREILSALSNSDDVWRSHPSYWAPFVMLGAL